MIYMLGLRSVVALIVAVCWTSAASADEAVVARVNSEPITAAEAFTRKPRRSSFSAEGRETGFLSEDLEGSVFIA